MDRRNIFDAVKRMLGRGYSTAEVRELDAAIDAAMRPDPPSEPETIGTPNRISKAGMDLIKRFEGCAKLRPDGMLEAYPDPGTGGDPWTIGWGATGQDIRRGILWTQRQADDWFEKHIVRYADDVAKALGSSLAGTSQAQFDALVSFHYNTGAIARATLTKLHKAGDYAGAAREFAKWNRAGGRVMAGLTRRRGEEAAMYRSGS